MSVAKRLINEIGGRLNDLARIVQGKESDAAAKAKLLNAKVRTEADINAEFNKLVGAIGYKEIMHRQLTAELDAMHRKSDELHAEMRTAAEKAKPEQDAARASLAKHLRQQMDGDLKASAEVTP